MQQGTTEWLRARAGKATASRIADIIAKTKSGPSASRKNYRAELVVERLTGEPYSSGFTNAAMQWGTEKEDEARAAYEFHASAAVEQVGFIEHPGLTWAGASPDGFVADEGLVEIKCPNTAQHIETLLGKEIPSKYVTQMLWQMACTGRKWCDFVSYDPRVPHAMQLFVKRLERDDAKIAELESEVRAFLAEVEDELSKLVKEYGEPERAAA